MFLDELEAAAEVVKWENEHLASKSAVHTISPDRPIESGRVTTWGAGSLDSIETQQLTISDELAAAADVVNWEAEQAQLAAISSELAAAAEIVQWEEDQAAGGGEVECGNLESDLTAAADIVDWEMENDFGGRYCIVVVRWWVGTR